MGSDPSDYWDHRDPELPIARISPVLGLATTTPTFLAPFAPFDHYEPIHQILNVFFHRFLNIDVNRCNHTVSALRLNSVCSTSASELKYPYCLPFTPFSVLE